MFTVSHRRTPPVRGTATQAALRHSVIIIALACLSAVAQAQPFPNGPINLVVPLAPGDAADITARLLGEEIARR